MLKMVASTLVAVLERTLQVRSAFFIKVIIEIAFKVD